ncbi:MAG: CCA tRNA nucleotidyltransferase [Cyanobacteria bacterium P01_C01_bin.73]
MLSPQTWPFDLNFLPDSAYLVGGSVRDALLNRRADYLDLDFVLAADAIETARHIAQYYHAGFVVLDAKHQIARVVFEQATLDFAQQVGNSLEADLHRRDFTVNAIAYHPHSETLLDPLKGYQDLIQRQLRMISIENLRQDPLRLLRAYRQAAQLGFTVESETQSAISQLSSLLAHMAAERVRGELDALLSTADGTPLIKTCWRDGLLADWLPDVTPAALADLTAIDQGYAKLKQTHPGFAQRLKGWVKEQTIPGMHRSWIKATKLSQLLSSDLDRAEATLTRLKYSRAEQQAVLAILRGAALLADRATCRPNKLAGELTIRDRYRLFQDVGVSFAGLALLAFSNGTPTQVIQPLLQHYLSPNDPVAYPRPLVSGRDLMKSLSLRPGPHIGELIEAIQLAQAEGHLQTAAEAIRWAQKQLRHTPPPSSAHVSDPQLNLPQNNRKKSEH